MSVIDNGTFLYGQLEEITVQTVYVQYKAGRGTPSTSAAAVIPGVS